MNEQKSWRFYGRQSEIDMLEKDLEFQPDPHGRRGGMRQFSTLKVRGRRGLGKTRLLQEMHSRAPDDLPFIFYELPNPSKGSASIEGINQELLLMAMDVGLGKDMQAILPAISEYTTDTFRFMDIMKAYMKLGAVVVFDEFHLARELGLVSYAKQVIDQGIFERRSHPGKILLMGSHQQKLQELFTASAPLYGRPNAYVHLRPWPLSTIMEMASEQGILAESGKFLTLWTAYGGVPRNWERYCTDGRFAHLHSIPNEQTWRDAFLEAERSFLAEPMERFDARTFIELEASVREILLWFGRTKPRGAQLSRLPTELGDLAAKLEACELLRIDLDLMDRYGPLLKTDHARWKITDQYTLFQVCVFRELMSGRGGHVRGRMAGNPERERLHSLEGHGMETLAEAFLAEQEGVNWHQTNVWHPAVADEGDIDVMAADTNSKPVRVWLGEAKRDTGQFNPNRIRAFQDRFLSVLGDDREARDIREGDLQRVLFAPTFSRKEHQHFASHGFQTMGIHDMARTYGIDPDPVHHSVPKHDREESLKPEPGFSPMKP